jgi:hypothetical protein
VYLEDTTDNVISHSMAELTSGELLRRSFLIAEAPAFLEIAQVSP